MKPRILSWNVRGLNKRKKRLRNSNLLRDWKADIICFQETKVHGISSSFVRSLWGCNHVDWCCLDSSGASGGILIMWDNRVAEKVDVCLGIFTLAVSFRNVVDRFVWAFVGVYGPNSDMNRSLLWDELAGILSWWSLPWCIGGDFNAARFPSERSGEGSRPAMREFSDFISELGLMDFPLAEGAFTWSRTFDPPVWSRIDRFLVSPDLEARFSVSSQKRLLRLYSDHFPILLDCGDFSRGNRSFKIENMWLKAEGFVGKVKQWWDSYLFQGTSSYAFACKLKALKKDLKIWNEEVFGKVERNKRKLFEDL
jgi:exonuclease III